MELGIPSWLWNKEKWSKLKESPYLTWVALYTRYSFTCSKRFKAVSVTLNSAIESVFSSSVNHIYCPLGLGLFVLLLLDGSAFSADTTWKWSAKDQGAWARHPTERIRFCFRSLFLWSKVKSFDQIIISYNDNICVKYPSPLFTCVIFCFLDRSRGHGMCWNSKW